MWSEAMGVEDSAREWRKKKKSKKELGIHLHVKKRRNAEMGEIEKQCYKSQNERIPRWKEWQIVKWAYEWA